MNQRLTQRTILGSAIQKLNVSVREMIDKLAEYEDLEEQGLILRLPCKVGDTIYIPYSRPQYIKEAVVQEITFDGVDFYIQTDFTTFSLRAINVYVFLTKSEAEKKLRKGELK